MARVPQKVLGDVVSVLHTIKDSISERELRSLSELSSLILAVQVDFLYPAVVVESQGSGDVLLKYNLIWQVSDNFSRNL